MRTMLAPTLWTQDWEVEKEIRKDCSSFFLCLFFFVEGKLSGGVFLVLCSRSFVQLFGGFVSVCFMF